MNQITVSGTLPEGDPFTAVISRQVIVVRIGERSCVAHPRWMNFAEVRQLRDALDDMLLREDHQ